MDQVEAIDNIWKLQMSLLKSLLDQKESHVTHVVLTWYEKSHDTKKINFDTFKLKVLV